MNPGIHLVHKPPGESSFAVLQRFLASHPGRRPRACHGGTLDPFAQGLLLVLVGPATHLFELLHPLPKRYLATVRWGTETDNLDPTGRVVAQGDPSALTPQLLDAALERHRGWQEQVPPATSAKKIGGEPAYRKAHRGEQVVLPPSRVYLHHARWTAHRLPAESTLELVVRGGYYVRSLARELGREIGATAHLAALERPEIGPWGDPGASPRWVHGPDVLPWCSRRELTDAEVGTLRQGGPIAATALRPPAWRPPAGFPDPEAPIAGLHRGRVLALLTRTAAGLALGRELRGGL